MSTARYRAKHKDRIAQRRAAAYHADPTAVKAQVAKYRQANRERYLALKRATNKRRRSKETEWERNRRLTHPEIYRAKDRKRRPYKAALGAVRRVKSRILYRHLPTEHKKEIAQFYANCPSGHQVDHIYPINGKAVSGLHVIWNLQYLPTKENQRKGNRV